MNKFYFFQLRTSTLESNDLGGLFYLTFVNAVDFKKNFGENCTGSKNFFLPSGGPITETRGVAATLKLRPYFLNNMADINDAGGMQSRNAALIREAKSFHYLIETLYMEIKSLKKKNKIISDWLQLCRCGKSALAEPTRVFIDHHQIIDTVRQARQRDQSLLEELRRRRA